MEIIDDFSDIIHDARSLRVMLPSSDRFNWPPNRLSQCLLAVARLENEIAGLNQSNKSQ